MSKVIFFDIDGVLIKKQTQKMFLIYLFKQKRIRLWKALLIYLWFFLYKVGLCKDVFNIRKFAFKEFRNWDKEIMRRLIEDFYHKVLLSNLNLNVINRLKEHQFQNDTVVFLSATIGEIADYLAEVFNVKFVIATKLELKGSKYTGRMIGSIPYGENKVELAKSFIRKNGLMLQGSFAYCDHFSDLSLLKYVSTPIVVNPDNQLKQLALLNKWEILIA